MSTPQSQSVETLSTLPDPRSPLTTPEISRSSSTSPHHPELSNEVAALSNKLIHAINHQTDLDDTLSETRHQLETAQERVRQLEPLVKEHHSLVANGILVRQQDVESELLRLKTTLADERRQRVKVENDKKGIEQELESLTTALFEEANEVRDIGCISIVYGLTMSRWWQPLVKRLARRKNHWSDVTSNSKRN